jgi:hypothetical protein
MTEKTSNNLSNFQVLRMIRDSRTTKHSERLLLNALALRANPAKGYRSWPSYALLSLDTMLDQKRVRRAAQALEAKNLIKRMERPNSTNLFFVNVALLAAQAEEALAQDKKKKQEDAGIESPFGHFEGSIDESEEPHADCELIDAVIGGGR